MSQSLPRCEHGTYIGSFERSTGKSSYCGLCNPDANADGPLLNAMAKRRHDFRIAVGERLLDVAEFISQSPRRRLVSAGIDFNKA